MSAPTKLWFRRKRFGWGWTPVSVEGWVSLGVYVAIIAAIVPAQHSHPVACAIGLIVATAGIIALGYLKGEAPAWQWGSKDK